MKYIFFAKPVVVLLIFAFFNTANVFAINSIGGLMDGEGFGSPAQDNETAPTVDSPDDGVGSGAQPGGGSVASGAGQSTSGQTQAMTQDELGALLEGLRDAQAALDGLRDAEQSPDLGDGTELGGSIGGRGSSGGNQNSESGFGQGEGGSEQSFSQCPNLYSQLAYGMSDATVGGGQVSALQQFLRTRYNEPQLTGGYFGPLTRSYVVRFQQEQGLATVGEVGPQTRARIQSLCGQVSNTLSGTVVGGECTLSGETAACDVTVYWNANGRAVHVNLVPPSGIEYNWSRLYFGYPNGAPATLRTSITKFVTPGNWQIKLYDAGTNKLLATDTITVHPAGTSQTTSGGQQQSTTRENTTTSSVVTGTITARGCTVGTDRSQFVPTNTLACDSYVSWTTNGAQNAYVVITGDVPYDTNSFPHGATAGNTLSGNRVKFWTKEGTYTATLYVDGVPPTQNTAGTGRVVDSKSFTVKSNSVPVAPGSVPDGSLSVKTCTVGLGKSTTDPNNPLICDAKVTWSTTNANSAYVLITGDFPYNSNSFPHGYVAGTNEIGTDAFWVTGGTYTAKLYVNGTPPSNAQSGSGTLVDTETFSIASPVSASAASLGQVANAIEAIRALLKSWQ